jgi:hypothetical protein
MLLVSAMSELVRHMRLSLAKMHLAMILLSIPTPKLSTHIMRAIKPISEMLSVS